MPGRGGTDWRRRGQEAGRASRKTNGHSANGTAKGTEADLLLDVVLWPDPPAAAAYHGIAGDVVCTVEPQTEADPVAILIQFLAAFGNAAGRKAYRTVGPRRHYPNLFCCLVGRTAIARKGTSWSWVDALLAAVDPDWHRDCVLCGLSSGEGLISALRDEGESDRRLMAVEEEFGSLLRAAARDGSILSPVLRQAWDGGRLRVLTRHNPLCASDCHVSIVGHVTPPELQHLLTHTEVLNGFANRFLWVCCRRSKLLPDGGENIDLGPLAHRVEDALEIAAHSGPVARGSSATQLWHEEYPRLTADVSGPLGAVTNRAAPQVLRLALLYALLDSAHSIRVEHLRAALAVWDYCYRSAEWIFGRSDDDPDLAKLLLALQAAGERGLSATEISGVFNRHKSALDLRRMLSLLTEQGKVKPGKPATGGKPALNWYFVAN